MRSAMRPEAAGQSKGFVISGPLASAAAARWVAKVASSVSRAAVEARRAEQAAYWAWLPVAARLVPLLAVARLALLPVAARLVALLPAVARLVWPPGPRSRGLSAAPHLSPARRASLYSVRCR